MSGSSDDGKNSAEKPRKRKITGRLSDVGKKLRISSHETGNPCYCKRFNCFTATSEDDRREILCRFNALASRDEQNQYLSGLITMLPVQQRRPRLDDDAAKYRDASFAYRVRIKDVENNSIRRDVPCCAKGFLAIHGISKSKLEYLQRSLKMTGDAPSDQRGKHTSMYRKLDESIESLICDHIKSFKGRGSHYSLHDSKKKYLPEDLTVKKMFELFKQKHPTTKVSYDSYRKIFNTKFNISFGYPRTDTCAICDEFSAKLKSLKPETDQAEIKKLTTMNELHKRKADTFFSRKRGAKIESKKDVKKEAICIDYAKNVPLPKIATNDVYYKRQLSMFSFNVHILSTGQSIFYVYHEGEAKKGGNEVASFLFHFITNFLDEKVEELHIFCDSAGGQNKNFTIFRFIHYITSNNIHGLKEIKMTFPIRGHSYMECDKNVGLWNLKTPMETPADFKEMIKSSRRKPSPFVVVSPNKRMVLDWKTMLDEKYGRKCPFKTQPIREIKTNNSRLVHHRATFNGMFLTTAFKRRTIQELRPGEFELPLPAYNGPLPIPKAKYEDIQSLLKFCGPEAVKFFKRLRHD